MPEPLDPFDDGRPISHTGAGGATDLAMEEGESLEKTPADRSAPAPPESPAPCGPTPGTTSAATRSSSSPA